MISLAYETMDDENINLAEKAYSELFPDSQTDYVFRVEYSGRFKDYGAHVELRGKVMTFKMSRKWYTISPEIQMGLIQELMQKLLKTKRHSMYIDVYNNFVKSLHLAIPKDNVDPQLQESFDRVNERYFLGLVEMPNLVWGGFSTSTYGSYDFKNDTVTISKAFKDVEDTKYVDYIMFHEVLHKQRKFFRSGSKTYYHDARFKRLEKVFEDQEQIEKELSRVVGREKAKAYYRKKREQKSEGAASIVGSKEWAERARKKLMEWF